jgi:hypothetical protein
MGHPSRTMGRGYEVKSAGFRLQSNLDKYESRQRRIALRHG